MITNIVHKIKKIFFYKKYNFLRYLRLILNKDQKIIIKHKSLILPPGHLLSLYNELYPDYDKFMFSVVTKLNENDSIIDIGANIGDTLYRIFHHDKNYKYYLIEADHYFFQYFKKNVSILTKSFEAKITLINELVGSELIGNLSKDTTGTKTLIQSDKGIKSKSLDRIISEYNIDNIALIKIDVDGYDFNVLFSGIKNITKFKPKLFFEYMGLNQRSYLEIIEKLHTIGYKNWFVISNYGDKIVKNLNYNDINNLIKSNKTNKMTFDIYCYC